MRSHGHEVGSRAALDAAIDAAVDAAVLHAPRPAGPVVAVVMSALDEGATIGAVLTALPGEVDGLPLLRVVVDDGSSDDTADRALAAGAVVARHPHNLGQGEGLRTGFKVAGRLGAEVVVTMDADGQHDPAELPSLVGPVIERRADYVQGSRFLGRYDDAGGARHVGIKGFTVLLNAFARTHVTDCTNGYRAIRGVDLARMRLVEDRFSAAEIIMEASARGLRILEVPVHVRSREVGVSRKPRGLGYPLKFLGVILRSWARSHPRERAGRVTAVP